MDTNLRVVSMGEGEAHNRKGRPPKYKTEFDHIAYNACLLGANLPRLATIFQVHIDTIYDWLYKHPTFSENVENGRYIADSQVANAIYRRALGVTVKEQKAIKLTTKIPNEDGKYSQTERIEIVELTREIPPDVEAGKFWLQNRQPKEWQDKRSIDVNSSNTDVAADRFTMLLEAAKQGVALSTVEDAANPPEANASNASESQ